jgi:RimJ/RimL family protein N-acetyltransferase
MSDVLHTPRLDIRPFLETDLGAIHRILDQAFGDGTRFADAAAREDRLSWLRWSALHQRWFPSLHQPPYGDRAVVLRESGELIGSVGLVPLLNRFEQIPALRALGAPESGLSTCEMGLFWVIDPARQRRGYATEAARALIDFAFTALRVHRVLATTEYTNAASQAVMCRLGMTVHRNPLPEPTWLQAVGVLLNPGGASPTPCADFTEPSPPPEC